MLSTGWMEWAIQTPTQQSLRDEYNVSLKPIIEIQVGTVKAFLFRLNRKLSLKSIFIPHFLKPGTSSNVGKILSRLFFTAVTVNFLFEIVQYLTWENVRLESLHTKSLCARASERDGEWMCEFIHLCLFYGCGYKGILLESDDRRDKRRQQVPTGVALLPFKLN